jgi:hypothetical protein
MSNLPFGFNPGPGEGDDGPGGSGPAGSGGGSPTDPLAAMFGAGGGDIGAAFQRLGQLLSW